MQVVESRRELQLLADQERARGQRIALVPTMGALHAGHLSLVDEGRKRADQVWVSIFVNPTQFNEAQDFEGYPRELERDLEACRAAGVDVVYAPGVEDVYPEGAQTWVDVEDLTMPLCGASRPGHFRGVTTVVSKLFLAAKPHVAVFGQKDFQQLAVIRRMTRDLGFDVEIVGGAIVREPDGVALSSRNVRLGPEARRQAVVLVRGLDAAEAAVAAGERDHRTLLGIVRAEIAKAPQAQLDYADLRDPQSLDNAPETLAGPTLLALAVHFTPDRDGRGADVRLIDNRVLQALQAAGDPQ
jgi:pantoate--beta-alanine ligase